MVVLKPRSLPTVRRASAAVHSCWISVLSWALLVCGGAHAATFVVDTTSDDGSAPFRVCDGDGANGNCSLRGALEAAAATLGPHHILFNLPTTDGGFVATTQHWRFQPAIDYPFIVNDLTIDGYSQPGAIANTNTADQGGSNAVLKIEIHRASPLQGHGLYVVNGGAGLTVRGLAISGFQRNIMLQTPGTHRVEGCFIGTDITGMTAAAPTLGSGIGVQLSGQVTIGGTDPAARNVISGNASYGVLGSSSGIVVMQGNLIGLDAAGTAAIPGQDYGIGLSQVNHGSLIGGATPNARNVLSGHEFEAIYQSSGSPVPPGGPRTRVLGNFFGTDALGDGAIGNGVNRGSPSQTMPTITVFGGGACGLQVGGIDPGEGNLIAHGGKHGVLVAACSQAPVIGNRFVRNRGLPLDLSTGSLGDGATGNDPGDPDGAPGELAGNRLQNRPGIIALDRIGDDYVLTYRVDTAPEHAAWPLRIVVERGVAGQPLDHVATDIYAITDAQQPKTVSFPAALLAGGSLVLSATDADGNTSEFGGDALFFSDFE